MKNRISELSIVKKAVIPMLIIILMQVIVPGVNAVSVLTEHHVVMIQGDDPGTNEKESESEIFAIERFFLSVPWNESIVEVPIPKRVKSMNIDQIVFVENMGYFPGEYSASRNIDNPPFRQFIDMEDMECCIANAYAWGFPSGSDRNLTYSMYMDSEEFKRYFDNISSDDVWNYSGDSMKLKPGQLFGEYISIPIKKLVIDSNVIEWVNITKVEMSWDISMHEENITFYIFSNNNGTYWQEMNGYEGEKVNFTTHGDELIWKINMTQDIEKNNTPVLNELWINVTFTPKYNDIILQLNYVVEKIPDTNKFEFTNDFNSDYIYSPFLHIIIYINKDYRLNTTGVPIMLFEEQTEYSDKDAYIFMSLNGPSTNFASITVQKTEEENQFPWIYLVIFILIAIFIVIILITRARTRKVEESFEGQEIEGLDEEMEKLTQRKEGLLKAIKKLDKDHEEGLLDEEVYNELKSGYKKKAAEVMKQMDALSASITTPPPISPEKDALLQKKDKIMKSIKKLDNDYKEGLLDEEVYKELRADYKRKAVDLMKELDENQ